MSLARAVLTWSRSTLDPVAPRFRYNWDPGNSRAMGQPGRVLGVSRYTANNGKMENSQKQCPEWVRGPRLRNESVTNVWGRRPHTFFRFLLPNLGPLTPSGHNLLHNCVFLMLLFLSGPAWAELGSPNPRPGCTREAATSWTHAWGPCILGTRS